MEITDLELIVIPPLGFRQFSTIMKYGTAAEIQIALAWINRRI